MLYIASDHGGFHLKNQLIQHLKSLDIAAIDMGPRELNTDDDYPDYIIDTVKKLQEGTGPDKPNDRAAIIICRNGVGVSMLANKYKDIRCVLSWSADHAKSSRVDDNTNVLALAADYTDVATAKEIVNAWLSTPFSNRERHNRRLNKFPKDAAEAR